MKRLNKSKIRVDLALDATDVGILTILQGRARTSNAEIGRRLKLAPSAVLERIRKLERRGVILQYATRVAPHAVGADLTAFAFVRTEEGRDALEVASALTRMPEVQEVHHVAGEDCLLIKLRTRDTTALGSLLRDEVQSIPGVRSTRTTIVFESAKESTELPLAKLAGEPVAATTQHMGRRGPATLPRGGASRRSQRS